MSTSTEERLRFTEALLAALLRERAGTPADGDLDFLQGATARARRAVGDVPVPGEARHADIIHGADLAGIAGERDAGAPPEPAVRPDAELPREVAWTPEPRAAAGPRLRPPPRPEPNAAELWIASALRATPGDWIARAGIGLLLIGVAFLCKYSIDQGWATPLFRVASGGAIGAALLAAGVRTHRRARPFSALFLGGAVGAWYTSTFAAYALYHLAPFPMAFGLMLATTLAAFALALWSGMELLALVGVVGGIGTPFVLSTGHASAPGFVAYLLFVLALTSAVYLARGWRRTFVVGVAGTWMALAAAQPHLLPDGAAGAAAARVAMTAGYAAVLLAGWVVFLVPRVLPDAFRATAAERERQAWWAGVVGGTAERVAVVEGYLAALLPALVAWASVGDVWHLEPQPSGGVALGMAAAMLLAHLALRRRLPALARAHAFSGAVAGAAGLALVSRTEPQGVAMVAVYAALLHAWAARRALGRPFRTAAHAAFALAGLVGLTEVLARPGAWDGRLAVAALGVCAYLVSAPAVAALRAATADGYRVAGHGAAAMVLWSVCEPLRHSGGWFAAGASAFALALMYVERRGDAGPVRGRPVDGVAALMLHAAALFTVLAFCGDFGAGMYPGYNERAAAEGALLASLIAGAVLCGPGLRRAWLGGTAYGLWLFATADQFAGLPAGPALTTGTWAATGLCLLLAALPRRHQAGVRVALGTIALVCAKLLLVDLAGLDPIWRILVFLGVGAAFLGVSYYVRNAWLGDEPGTGELPAEVSLAEP